jgi:transcriptional regulator with XRE-family HTH domain
MNVNAWSFIRLLRGLTIEQADDKSGVSGRSISNYEAGCRQPGPKEAVKLARAYEAPYMLEHVCNQCEVAKARKEWRKERTLCGGKKKARRLLPDWQSR